MPGGTVETLHGGWTLVEARTDSLKLSLKLYHARELQLHYLQLTKEAPRQHTPDETIEERWTYVREKAQDLLPRVWRLL